MIQQPYNSDLNFVGSIPNYDLLFLALSKIEREGRIKEIEEILVTRNLFDFRTEEARGRFFRMIKSTIFNTFSEEQSDLLASIFDEKCNFQNKNIIFFWQLCLSNRLFRDISVNVYLKNYFAGRSHLTARDVEDFVLHLKETDSTIKNWSFSTIKTLSSKYLTILKKLNLLEGANKKQILPVTIDNNTMVLFVYLIKSINPDNFNFLESEYFQLSLMSKETFLSFAKKVGNMSFWNMTFDGNELKFTLKQKPNNIAHALFN
jgi:hypothetical protein